MPDRNLLQSHGVFQAGHGSTVQIHGGQFIQHNQAQNIHNCHEADDGFKHLQAHVATSAFDSPEHVDAPKCHANTRIAVLDEIMNWIILTVARMQWILWLNGAAGAGKSAIGRSIVDRCIQRNIPVARFFFFRTDSTRNNVKPLVATLAHQLIQSIPDLAPIIIPRIKSDPLIFTKSLKTQFEFLIFGPLRELKRSAVHFHMLVLFFDGVDECNDCDDQASLIRIVADFVGSDSFPAIAFFASRNEDQISSVFRSATLSNITRRLALDDNYLPDHDIRAFLNDSFDEIKSTHPFGHQLDSNWPTAPDVQDIVEKSSGQFIYAAVVIKFISMLDLHPEQQLQIVRGLRPRGAITPFAQLDALYRHIFSRVRDLQITSLILAWTILTPNTDVEDCAEFLKMQTADVHVVLAPLKSIIDTSGTNIHFLHASLPDFLLDKERSQEHYINLPSWSTRLSVMAFEFVLSNGDQGYIPADLYLTGAQVTAELRNRVFAYNPENIDYSSVGVSDDFFPTYLRVVRRLDFGDGPGGTVYQRQLNVIVRYISKNNPAALDRFGQIQGMSDIWSQIERDSSTKKKLCWLIGKIFMPMRKSKHRSRTEAREAGIRCAARGGASVARRKTGLSRLFKK